jgi:sugar/nucleoside kinase (ribokinase family)
LPGTKVALEKVVDPTGAGNGFMGALAAALGEGESLREGESFDFDMLIYGTECRHKSGE